MDFVSLLALRLMLADFSSLLMIATVLSTANHTEERQVIRESWASGRESKFIREIAQLTRPIKIVRFADETPGESDGIFERNKDVTKITSGPPRKRPLRGKTHHVTVFFIISSTSKNDLHNLQKEQEEHDDLIITDLHEAYKNLHLKVYASMVFHQQYCPSAQFLMKVDDDVALNLDRVVDSWKKDNESSRSIFCRVWKKARPDRNIRSKYHVPKDVWPNKHYPPYCSGPMYIMGREASQLILDYARLFTPLALDDIFYTGIIAEKAKIRRVHWEASVSLDIRNFSLECNKSKEVKIFVHSLHSPKHLRTVFQLMKDSKPNYNNDITRSCIVCLLILALFCVCY